MGNGLALGLAIDAGPKIIETGDDPAADLQVAHAPNSQLQFLARLISFSTADRCLPIVQSKRFFSLRDGARRHDG